VIEKRSARTENGRALNRAISRSPRREKVSDRPLPGKETGQKHSRTVRNSSRAGLETGATSPTSRFTVAKTW